MSCQDAINGAAPRRDEQPRNTNSGFRQEDVTRALRATTAAGVEVQRVEIARDGRITLILRRPLDQEKTELSPLESWRVSRGPR